MSQWPSSETGFCTASRTDVGSLAAMLRLTDRYTQLYTRHSYVSLTQAKPPFCKDRASPSRHSSASQVVIGSSWSSCKLAHNLPAAE